MLLASWLHRVDYKPRLRTVCGENKGADQLRGYHEADLRLCFRICKTPVFSQRCSFVNLHLCAYAISMFLPSAKTRGRNVKHFYNGVVQVQDHFRYGLIEIDM